MLPACFHAAAGDRPETGVQVDFSPPRTDHLARPGCGQDCKLESTGCDPVPLAQLRQERGQVAIWQRRMMHRLRDRLPGRQEVVQMPAPSGRVLTLPLADHPSVIEDAFEPTA
jgi:hypothetical protein